MWRRLLVFRVWGRPHGDRPDLLGVARFEYDAVVSSRSDNFNMFKKFTAVDRDMKMRRWTAYIKDCPSNEKLSFLKTPLPSQLQGYSVLIRDEIFDYLAWRYGRAGLGPGHFDCLDD